MRTASPRHIERVVEQVHKRVPEARVEMTEERLPRWNLANRTVWLEWDPHHRLLISGTKGGGYVVTHKHKRDDDPGDDAERITELLVAPIQPVEEGAERI